MNYKNTYDRIIESALIRGYVNGYSEVHHIIPTSMGGSNSAENKVRLTAREHYLCHWLLWKIYNNDKMCFAWMSMNRKNSDTNFGRYITSRGYEHAKKLWAAKMSNIRKNMVVSDETRAKQSAAKIGCTPWNKGVKMQKKKTKKRIEYESSPKRCALCGVILPYKKRINTYCSPQCCNAVENSKKDYSRRPVSETAFKQGYKMSEQTKKKISTALLKYHAKNNIEGAQYDNITN